MLTDTCNLYHRSDVCYIKVYHSKWHLSIFVHLFIGWWDLNLLNLFNFPNRIALTKQTVVWLESFGTIFFVISQKPCAVPLYTLFPKPKWWIPIRHNRLIQYDSSTEIEVIRSQNVTEWILEILRREWITPWHHNTYRQKVNIIMTFFFNFFF